MEIIEASKIEGVKSEPVEYFEADELYEKSTEMYELIGEKKGLGLAAPQVGIFKQMFVMLDNLGKPETIFNPQYFRDGGKTNTVEGCLSYPDEYYYLKRWKRISMVYYIWNGVELIKRTGKATGMRAIIFQHETDHLNGKTVAMWGEPIEKDKLRKKKNRDGEEFKVPQL
jgi:peptide deformylase